MECENFISDLGVVKQCYRLKTSYKEMIANAFQTLNEFEKLSFIENCTEIASKWLHELPVETKTTIFNANFCAALCSRLLLTPRCRNDCSRERITHFEQCSCFSQMKVSRHESIKKILADIFRGTRSTVTLETFNENHERRADLLVTSPQGKTAFDISVVSILSKKNFRSIDSLREALNSLVVKKFHSIS
eukprot:snap_masked-scaffold_21-processed-gene-0.9-mRNA-1 protein AED:1.00 eAED:1.00 QI:0/-1/0/0/-1/1/1/0/189